MLFRVVLAVAILVIYVYGLVDVIRTDRRLTRGISKPAWLIVVTVLPVIGAILWLLIGRPRDSAPVRQPRSHPTAPDDDPDFLRNLERRRRNQAEAARLKKLQDDLEAKAKADGGPAGTGQDNAGTRGKGGIGHEEAGDASTGDTDTHDTGDVK
ncbi:PLD nuclease N-terminal domain-containing protein [Arthrobacter sp. MDT3-24]